LPAEEVLPKVEDFPSTTGAAESEPAEQVEVTGPENPLLLESESVTEPSNGVVDAEPVIATPLSTPSVTEDVVEPIAVEEVLVVDPVEDVTPDVVAEEKLAVDEPEVPVLEPQEVVEESVPAAPAPVEESEPSPEVTRQEVPVPVVSDPIVEPEVPAPESREAETVPPAVPPEEEGLSVGGAGPEEATPAISEPVEAAQDVTNPDLPPEETKQVERPWTPSYSVSSQGGGLDDGAPADEEAAEPTAPEPLVEEPAAESVPAPAPEIVTPAEVRAFVGSSP